MKLAAWAQQVWLHEGTASDEPVRDMTEVLIGRGPSASPARHYRPLSGTALAAVPSPRGQGTHCLDSRDYRAVRSSSSVPESVELLCDHQRCRGELGYDGAIDGARLASPVERCLCDDLMEGVVALVPK